MYLTDVAIYSHGEVARKCGKMMFSMSNPNTKAKLLMKGQLQRLYPPEDIYIHDPRTRLYANPMQCDPRC